jgi:hypothetical protein
LPDYDDYVWLIGDGAAKWLAAVAADARPELQQLASLRKDLTAERARLVVEQAALRGRAREKFGELAERMFFTPVHLEQATDLGIARYKAARFAAVVGDPIGDYCCGIGGDFIALAEVRDATGWDLSPVACLLAEANVRAAAAGHRQIRIKCGDVAAATPVSVWHIDPDRRAGGRRAIDVVQFSPGVELIDHWLASAPDGAVKLAPATPSPHRWTTSAELEWISSGRECRQQVAWFGQLANPPGMRRATIVARGDDRDSAVASLVGLADQPCQSVPAPAAFLYDPDAAVLAASLLGELAEQRGLRTLGAGGAYLTGDHRADDPLLAGFAVQDCLPLRPAVISSYLAARHVGNAEIKKRGVETSPEALRKKLRLHGDGTSTVILTRIGRKEVAIIAERLTARPSGVNEQAVSD